MEVDVSDPQQTTKYGGYVIRVLVMPEYGPPPPNARYSYVGSVYRPGADVKVAGQQVFFSHPLPDYANEAEAFDAGFREGESIVNGVHPTLSVSVL